jgi:DNA-binding transcriptional ArsR family regulator
LTRIFLVWNVGPVETVFEVLAEPRRREILGLVHERERTVGELVGLVGLRQPSVSKHLRVLREAGLVAVRGDQQRRVYRATPTPLRELDDWLAPFRASWAGGLDLLAAHLDVMKAEEERDDGAPGSGHAGAGR